MANVVSSAAIGFGVITKFTATQWFKEGAFAPPVNGFLGRMFVLGAGTAATDVNAVNTIGHEVATAQPVECEHWE